jgi:hypothetical protein
MSTLQMTTEKFIKRLQIKCLFLQLSEELARGLHKVFSVASIALVMCQKMNEKFTVERKFREKERFWTPRS